MKSKNLLMVVAMAVVGWSGMSGGVFAEGLRREMLKPGTLPGMVLQHNVRYCVGETFRIDASGLPGMSALRVPPGAAVVLDIAKDATLTVVGGPGIGRLPAGAGIEVPVGSKLVVCGAGRLEATGGAGMPGVNGYSGYGGQLTGVQLDGWPASLTYGQTGAGGAGGDGGGGAAAAIGGRGGYGGRGGGGGRARVVVDKATFDAHADNYQEFLETFQAELTPYLYDITLPSDGEKIGCNGSEGMPGEAGQGGAGCGEIIVAESAEVVVTGGASGGTGGKCGWYGVTTPCYSSDPGNASLDSALASIIIGDAATITAEIADFFDAAKIAAGLTVGGVTVTTVLAIIDLVGGYDRARLKGRLWFVGGGGGGGGGSGAGAGLAIGAGGAGGGGGGGGGSGFFLIGAGSIYPNHADKPDVESPLPLSGHGGLGGGSSVKGASGADASAENNGEAKHTERGERSGSCYNCVDGAIGTWSWRRDGDNWAWSGKGAAGGAAGVVRAEMPTVFRGKDATIAGYDGEIADIDGQVSYPVRFWDGDTLVSSNEFTCGTVIDRAPAIDESLHSGLHFVGYARVDASGRGSLIFDRFGFPAASSRISSAIELTARWSEEELGRRITEVRPADFAEGAALDSNVIYTFDEDRTWTGPDGKPGVTLSSGTTVFYIPRGCKVRFVGADGQGASPGQPGIVVPSDATLIVVGEGRLEAKGGAAGAGGNGANGGLRVKETDGEGYEWMHVGDGGDGGAGGGGAAAAIGGAGGIGGEGGSGAVGPARKSTSDGSGFNDSGNAGGGGAVGGAGAAAGAVYVLGRVVVDVESGAAGAGGGYGSDDPKGDGRYWWFDDPERYYSGGNGGGGGGGGGGGAPLAAIGGGGAGGGGGGGGGSGGRHRDHGDDQLIIVPWGRTGAGGAGGAQDGGAGQSAQSSDETVIRPGENYSRGMEGAGGASGDSGAGGAVWKSYDATVDVTAGTSPGTKLAFGHEALERTITFVDAETKKEVGKVSAQIGTPLPVLPREAVESARGYVFAGAYRVDGAGATNLWYGLRGTSVFDGEAKLFEGTDDVTLEVVWSPDYLSMAEVPRPATFVYDGSNHVGYVATEAPGCVYVEDKTARTNAVAAGNYRFKVRLAEGFTVWSDLSTNDEREIAWVVERASITNTLGAGYMYNWTLTPDDNRAAMLSKAILGDLPEGVSVTNVEKLGFYHDLSNAYHSVRWMQADIDGGTNFNGRSVRGLYVVPEIFTVKETVSHYPWGTHVDVRCNMRLEEIVKTLNEAYLGEPVKVVALVKGGYELNGKSVIHVFENVEPSMTVEEAARRQQSSDDDLVFSVDMAELGGLLARTNGIALALAVAEEPASTVSSATFDLTGEYVGGTDGCRRYKVDGFADVYPIFCHFGFIGDQAKDVAAFDDVEDAGVMLAVGKDGSTGEPFSPRTSFGGKLIRGRVEWRPRERGVYRLEHEVTHPVTDKDNLWAAEFDLTDAQEDASPAGVTGVAQLIGSDGSTNDFSTLCAAVAASRYGETVRVTGDVQLEQVKVPGGRRIVVDGGIFRTPTAADLPADYYRVRTVLSGATTVAYQYELDPEKVRPVFAAKTAADETMGLVYDGDGRLLGFRMPLTNLHPDLFYRIEGKHDLKKPGWAVLDDKTGEQMSNYLAPASGVADFYRVGVSDDPTPRFSIEEVEGGVSIRSVFVPDPAALGGELEIPASLGGADVVGFEADSLKGAGGIKVVRFFGDGRVQVPDGFALPEGCVVYVPQTADWGDQPIPGEWCGRPIRRTIACRFAENEDGMFVLVGCGPVSLRVLDLPDVHEGRAVEVIATGAVSDAPNLEEIAVPSGVKLLEDGAFGDGERAGRLRRVTFRGAMPGVIGDLLLDGDKCVIAADPSQEGWKERPETWQGCRVDYGD